MKTFSIYSLSNFRVCHTAALTLVMFYMASLLLVGITSKFWEENKQTKKKKQKEFGATLYKERNSTDFLNILATTQNFWIMCNYMTFNKRHSSRRKIKVIWHCSMVLCLTLYFLCLFSSLHFPYYCLLK